MRIRTVGVLLVLILMAIFLVVNWTAVSQVTTVNLIFKEVQAPLGLIIVVGFAAIVGLMLIYSLVQQAGTLYEVKAAYKEARQARAMAEEADKSRIAEFRSEVEQRLGRIEALLEARTGELLQNSRTLEEKFAAFEDEVAAQQQGQKKEVLELVSGGLKDVERRVNEIAAGVNPAAAEAAESGESKKKKDMFSDLF